MADRAPRVVLKTGTSPSAAFFLTPTESCTQWGPQQWGAWCWPSTPAFHPGLVPSGCYELLCSSDRRLALASRPLDTLLSLLETLSSSLPNAQHSLSSWLIHDTH